MIQQIRLAAPLQKESVVDGKGIRMVIWSQGCNLKCKECHNPETWDSNSGRLINLDEVKKFIYNNKEFHQGITLTGGDPFLQPEANLEIAKYAHSLGLDVWAYCGLTFEQIMRIPAMKKLLLECDVLVDGPFILKQRDVSLAFRGSSNQRIIDVQKSLSCDKIILYME